MVIKMYMIPVYGRLVMYGKMTVDENEKDKDLVPEIYIPYVCEWLIAHGVQ